MKQQIAKVFLRISVSRHTQKNNMKVFDLQVLFKGIHDDFYLIEMEKGE
ncbi:MAG: hypothetical protein H6Q13_1848 [Bacteroidetes bacterium]|nr:hypothetical protein [Bacteroidota bacterium]